MFYLILQFFCLHIRNIVPHDIAFGLTFLGELLNVFSFKITL